MSEGEVLLSVEGVSLELDGHKILEGVTFDVIDRVRPGVTTGQVVGLLGPSGVGKTRLLRIIAGLDEPSSGAVAGIKRAPMRAGEVGFVFQDYPLLAHRTVRGNLELAGKVVGLSAKESTKRTDELLAAVGLDARADFYPAQLSGGQRQRAAIAQQLVQPRRLLLMDEPFSGLDPVALRDVMKLISEVANVHDFNTVLLVTHDIRAALIACDTLHLLGRRGTNADRASGAAIQHSYDLVAQGFAYHPNIEDAPEFAQKERAIREQFRDL